jgi:hypothetical protein
MQCISPRIFWTIAALALLSFHPARALAGPVFTFDDMSQVSPLVATEGGLTATFGSPAGPGGAVIAPGFFRAPFSGNALFNNPTSQNTNDPLTVSFNKAVRSVSLDFATIDRLTLSGNGEVLNSTFKLEAFSGGLNGTLVGTVTAIGTRPQQIHNEQGGMTPNVLLLLDPQGVINFTSNTPFDTLEFSAGPGVNFAIDNLVVNVPEPTGLALAGVTLAGLGFRAWRRRRTGAKS